MKKEYIQDLIRGYEDSLNLNKDTLKKELSKNVPRLPHINTQLEHIQNGTSKIKILKDLLFENYPEELEKELDEDYPDLGNGYIDHSKDMVPYK